MKVFQPVCSLPEYITGYVSGPNIRGTLDIIWTCLGTLLLCTWTIQHLNIPIDVIPKNAIDHIRHHVYLSARKSWWMFITLIAPEIIMGKAVMDKISAQHATSELKEFKEEDGVSWTLTHSFFANMGGFAIKFDNPPRFSNDDTSPAMIERPSSLSPGAVPTPLANNIPGMADKPRAIPASPPAHLLEPSSEKSAPHVAAKEEMGQAREKTTADNARIVADVALREFYKARLKSRRWKYHVSIWDWWLMGETRWKVYDENEKLAVKTILSSVAVDVGNQKQTSYYYNIMALRGNVWVLDAQQLLLARKKRIIERLPEVEEHEINDRSKGDAVVKAMALFHSLWLAAGLIVRAIQGLPVTQLEIMTLAFVLCALVTYIALWSKPKDVYTRVCLRAARQPSVDEMKALGRRGPTTFFYLRAETWIPNNSVHYLDVEKVGWPRYLACNNCLQISLVGAFIGAVLFGAVHLIAWHFEFPTQVERLLWQVACVLTMVVPVLILLTMRYATEIRDPLFGFSLVWIKKIVAFLLGTLMTTHALGRVYIIVESLRALTSLPVGAFMATDVLSVIPHLG